MKTNFASGRDGPGKSYFETVERQLVDDHWRAAFGIEFAAG